MVSQVRDKVLRRRWLMTFYKFLSLSFFANRLDSMKRLLVWKSWLTYRNVAQWSGGRSQFLRGQRMNWKHRSGSSTSSRFSLRYLGVKGKREFREHV